ncbi:multidrug resistance protein D [Legionella lansingensis]|uniref:Bcr/CflA family efflux transporter n=1 Tax=Legionella lansingensis TaxID=45067 RepID=A0A0W0VQL1_9GAMM|nr:multidrug effflux MFS transporter [Legionella lansingensis]KTD22314.1 multidrug resistance protein D [Legionella lansingensis]SNV50730.1 multidrug resistance protein D [Legionella lansingensis]
MPSKPSSPESQTTPFLFLGSLSTFSLLTFDLYQPALPAITTYFNTTPALGQLTLSLFFFVFGFSQLIWGPLIDHFGRQSTLRLSLILFFIATLGCIFSINIEFLILSRTLQGFAVCCAHVVAFSSSRDYEDSTDRARVLSHITMIVSVSPIFAPLIGSLIFMHYGWQATFVVMALISVLLFVLAARLLKEAPNWSKNGNSFLWRASLASYKNILTHKRFWIGIALASASYSCVMIVIVNAAYLIIDHLKISPFYFSILFGINGIMLILGNYIGIKLREKKSLIWNIRLGSMTMILSSSVMLAMLLCGQDLTLLGLAPILVIALGISLLNPPTFSIVLEDYKQQAATATGILNTIRMTLAAVIGGLSGAVITYHFSVLPISLFICSLICLIFSFLIWED